MFYLLGFVNQVSECFVMLLDSSLFLFAIDDNNKLLDLLLAINGQTDGRPSQKLVEVRCCGLF